MYIFLDRVFLLPRWQEPSAGWSSYLQKDTSHHFYNKGAGNKALTHAHTEKHASLCYRNSVLFQSSCDTPASSQLN